MRQRLTDRSIKQKPPATGQTEIWDTVVPGLACRISYGGRRTFTIMTRIDKRQIRRTVGHYPNLSLSDAREPHRVCRRLFGLSQATIASSLICA